MKKFLSLMLALVFVLSMFAMTSCNNEKDPDDTKSDGTGEPAANTEDTKAPDTQAPDTQAPATEPVDTNPPSDEPNMFPYDGEVQPGSIGFEWGAPDAESVYFSIDEAHIIHDGKGQWGNQIANCAKPAFDKDSTPLYDCDEMCEYENTAEEDAVGLVLENWNGDTEKTGYVGAWIESGVVLSQIRWYPRVGDNVINERPIGCKFQASVDGVEWVDLHQIEEVTNAGGDYEFVDIEDETVYYYVRFLSRDHVEFSASYCDIAEIEIWGTPGK